MSTADVVVVVAAGIGSLGAVVCLGAAFLLVNQVRRLERGIEALRHEALPLLEEARAAAGHAANEIARVDAVLADTESVTAAVDQAARMARRAFANPVVKVLAWRAGAVGGLRRLRSPEARRIAPRGTRGGAPTKDTKDPMDPKDPKQPTAGRPGRQERQEHVEALEVAPVQGPRPRPRRPLVGPRR